MPRKRKSDENTDMPTTGTEPAVAGRVDEPQAPAADGRSDAPAEGNAARTRRPVGRPRKNPEAAEAAKPAKRRGRPPGKSGTATQKRDGSAKGGTGRVGRPRKGTTGTAPRANAAKGRAASRRPQGRPARGAGAAAGTANDLAASISYGEGSGRGSAKLTRKRILAAARMLFARNGMDGVSVRAIAQEAGVNHALVHRYFGSKMDMISEIVQNEISSFGQISMPVPTDDLNQDLARFRELIRQVLTGFKTTAMLILRAEMDGLNPSTLVQSATPRGIGNLAEWIATHQRRAGDGQEQADGRLPDAQAAAMIIAGAVFSMVAAENWLASAVGLLEEPEEARRERLLDSLVIMLAQAIGHPLAERPDGT